MTGQKTQDLDVDEELKRRYWRMIPPLIILVFVVVLLCAWRMSQIPEGSNAFPQGQLVRHRMDGRLGVVLDVNHEGLMVRFSCNYTAGKNFETFCCQPFELIPLTNEEEEELYWRRRERPPHSKDQTELP